MVFSVLSHSQTDARAYGSCIENMPLAKQGSEGVPVKQEVHHDRTVDDDDDEEVTPRKRVKREESTSCLSVGRRASSNTLLFQVKRRDTIRVGIAHI